jgi:hypothetical protein
MTRYISCEKFMSSIIDKLMPFGLLLEVKIAMRNGQSIQVMLN